MLKKLQQTQKTINQFINQTKKDYQSMKKKLSKIWALVIISIIAISCNVTRTITTESQAYQKGDTAVHITTKTTEMYNATKNN